MKPWLNVAKMELGIQYKIDSISLRMASNFILKGRRETTRDRSYLMLKVLCITVTPRHLETRKKGSVSSSILWFQRLSVYWMPRNVWFMKHRFQNFYLDGETHKRTYILRVIWLIKERKLEWSSDRVAISVFLRVSEMHSHSPEDKCYNQHTNIEEN